jgi:hypothetical protein
MPCSARIFTSSAAVCPSRVAFSAAISAEIAISPAMAKRDWPFDGEFSVEDGNDNTSVALFFPRNWRFKARTAVLLVTKTFATPRKPAARRARSTKRSSDPWVSAATVFCRMINRRSDGPPDDSRRVNRDLDECFNEIISLFSIIYLWPSEGDSSTSLAICLSPFDTSAFFLSLRKSICCSAPRPLCSS